MVDGQDEGRVFCDVYAAAGTDRSGERVASGTGADTGVGDSVVAGATVGAGDGVAGDASAGDGAGVAVAAGVGGDRGDAVATRVSVVPG